MSGRGFVDFFVIFRKQFHRTDTQQCLLNQASPVKKGGGHWLTTLVGVHDAKYLFHGDKTGGNKSKHPMQPEHNQQCNGSVQGHSWSLLGGLSTLFDCAHNMLYLRTILC